MHIAWRDIVISGALIFAAVFYLVAAFWLGAFIGHIVLYLARMLQGG